MGGTGRSLRRQENGEMEACLSNVRMMSCLTEMPRVRCAPKCLETAQKQLVFAWIRNWPVVPARFTGNSVRCATKEASVLTAETGKPPRSPRSCEQSSTLPSAEDGLGSGVNAVTVGLDCRGAIAKLCGI